VFNKEKIMYSLLQPLLFKLDAETAHNLTLRSLTLGDRTGLLPFVAPRVVDSPCEVVGLSLKNRIGLAAGLDKNADYVDELGKLGFGFIEVGTVTPRPQRGNSKPRLFRLPEAKAIINRMGFNNKGVDHLVERLKKRTYQGVVGVNIGKNADTPFERAHDDYVYCLQKVYTTADYVVVNISSPNTQGLRDLQEDESLARLLESIAEAREAKIQETGVRKPLFLKIAPDLSNDSFPGIVQLVQKFGLEGITATNTTISRESVHGQRYAVEQGGLSGRPLTLRSREVVRLVAEASAYKLPIIGVGGVFSGEDGRAIIEAGAALVQIYTGLVYRGPRLIAELAQALAGMQPQSTAM
jgi:dihydroorotate dehydrogenase